MPRTCTLIGAPIETGTDRGGCLMGPAALRTAGLARDLSALGWDVKDRGDLAIAWQNARPHENRAVHHLAETAAWTAVLAPAAQAALEQGHFPIFLGGDHSMSAGTLSGVAAFAARSNRPQFVLWLDAHSDFHALDTTVSGNLHGTPMAYATGQPGFDAFPPLTAPIPAQNVCMMGLRSVDPAEHNRLLQTGIDMQDMRALDETGVLRPLKAFLNRVRAANGMLHVSLDVDFLDPSVAPAVGTTVPGGATLREAHLIMETLCDSALVTSLDLAELNPFLDDRGRTATVLVDLAASLFGRRVLDRRTPAFAA